MPDPADPSDEENWRGGFYELAMQSPGRLPETLAVLLRVAGIEDAVEDGHLRGTVTLPGGRRTVCGCFTFGDDDWLDFYLPLGALARTDRRIGGFPFSAASGPESLEWRHGLDAWLAGLARAVFREVPFRLARIGFELDADVPAADAPERWEGLLVPSPAGLVHIPANR